MRIRYDRGTLLIDGPAGEVDQLQAPEILWDPRVEAWRAPAYRHAALVATARQRGLEVRDDVRIPDDRPAVRRPKLRPYQEDALMMWMMRGRRGCVSLPTGSGKTVLALAAMEAVGAPSLVLVPTRVLLEQWRAVLAAHGVEAGVYGDGQREVRSVTVCTFESAFRKLDEFGDRFRLLVIDEAHHFGGGVRTEALEMAVAPWRLGLSATLPDSGEPATRIAELIGPTVFELRVGDLVGKHLAPLDHVVLPVDLDASERASYDEAHGPFARASRMLRHLHPQGDWGTLMRELSRTEGGREALRGWHRARALLSLPGAKRSVVRSLLERHAGQRALIFTADTYAAYTLSRELLLPAITGEIRRAERAAFLDAYRRGELNALIAARVLNEGFDVPDAEVGIVLGGALGGREHVQRAGRILRPRPGKRAVLYEVVVRDSLEWRQSRRRRKHLGVAGAAPQPAATAGLAAEGPPSWDTEVTVG